MGDTCGPQPNGFSPVCTRARQLAERTLSGLRASERRKRHGLLVAEGVDGYFQKLSPRVEHGPLMNRLVASTTLLAQIHQLTLYGRDRGELSEFMGALERGIPTIPGFGADMGLPPAIFCGDLQRYIEQYRTVFSHSYILSEDSKMLDFVRLIKAGGLELPPLLVVMADFALPLEKAVEGLPKGETVSEGRRKLWSDKIREVVFPLADLIGWQDAANSMRHNAVLWNPDLSYKLEAKERWLRENAAALSAAGALLQEISDRATRKILGEVDGKPPRVQYEKDGPMTKTGAAIVIKEDEKPGKPVMDLVRTRYIFQCDGMAAEGREGTNVQDLGYEVLGSFRSSGAFSGLKIQDNYRKPKRSGYRAIHITGFLLNGFGIPVEVILIDEDSYKNAACGRCNRALYKGYNGRANPEDVEKFEAVDRLLEPILDAALALSKMPARAQQASPATREDTVAYTVYNSGESQPCDVKPGSTVLDVMVRYYLRTGQPIRNAEVYEGPSEDGRRLGIYEKCPPEITIKPLGEFSYGTILQVYRNPRVNGDTKRALREFCNGK
ncbi:MAG: hypothetical protein AB1657_02540 [Candidatus Micrarchaeota archaeon]